MAAEAAPGRAPVGIVETILAVPPGSERPRSRRQLMAAAAACPGLAAHQVRRQDKLLAFLRVYARWASWFDGPAGPRGTAWPTRAQVCAEAAFGATTYRLCRRFWAQQGYLGIVREGRTKTAR